MICSLSCGRPQHLPQVALQYPPLAIHLQAQQAEQGTRCSDPESKEGQAALGRVEVRKGGIYAAAAALIMSCAQNDTAF